MLRVVLLAGLVATRVFAAAPAFEVASVRVNPNAGRGLGAIQYSRDGVTMRGVSMWLMVRWAYGIGNYQISGPDSMQSPPFYDVEAKAAGAAPVSSLRLMMRALLAERFHFAGHEETRERAVTELRVAKGGAKFRESAGKFDPGLGAEAPLQFFGFGSDVHIQRSQAEGGRIRDTYTDISMPEFALLLEGMGSKSALDKVAVVDRTGLKDRYDFVIENQLGPSHEGEGATSADDDGLARWKPIFERELGLTFGHGQAAVKVLAVDHVDKTPIEN